MATPDLTALTSPSKAARNASLARSWSHVATWLTRLYHPHSVPRFERNEDTLNALLTLAAANESADEEAALLFAAIEGEVETLGGSEDVDVDRLVQGSLDERGVKAMEGVSGCVVELGVTGEVGEGGLGVKVGEEISALATGERDVGAKLAEVERLHRQVEAEAKRVKRQVDDLRDLGEKADEEFDAEMGKVGDWNRGTKMLGLKVGEYQERLRGLERNVYSGVTIEETKGRERSIGAMQERVKGLEKSLIEFGGLPPDFGAAKEELDRATRELVELQQRRDDLFESMV